MNQWIPRDSIDSLPPKYGDKLDLLGSIIVDIGNVFTTIGIAKQKEEVEQIEEAETSNNIGGEKSNSDLGFILAFIGSTIITIGDVISTAGIAIEIEQSLALDKQAEQDNKEQDKKIKEMQNQINILQKEMNSLLRLTDSLKREVFFLQIGAPARYYW